MQLRVFLAAANILQQGASVVLGGGYGSCGRPLQGSAEAGQGQLAATRVSDGQAGLHDAIEVGVLAGQLPVSCQLSAKH